jgi:nitroimidazol reductase NimA-like FMN-containing flavoprotein (pyridoxamine 5'-phosphate oxidase superfamily)
VKHVEYIYTHGMTESEIEHLLRDTPNATLGLADGGDAYAIPISIDYDEEGNLWVRMGVHEGSEKMAFVEATETASILLFDDPTPKSSWSILVRGTLRPLDEDDQTTFTETDINERFPPLRVFGEEISDLTPKVYRMEIEEITGRKTTW